MTDREKVLQALEHCDLCSDMPNCSGCAYLREPDCMEHLKRDIIALLKAQEPPTSGFISSAIECLLHPQDADESDMAKAIDTAVRTMRLLKAQEPATVEPNRIELADETKEWLDKMDAVDALGNIANICIDWDGYRTADGLGGLINEIWAYARYCADRLAKEQEPRVMTLEEVRDEAEYMYLEKHSETGSDLYGCAIRGDWDGYGIELLMSEYDTVRERWSEYGKRWRCWTSRPTNAQREATLWYST